MRILHLSHGYPPAIGGSETLIAELSKRLVARYGHEVTAITTTALSTAAFRIPGTPTLTPGELWMDGVRVRRNPVSSRLAPRIHRLQDRAFRYRIPGNGVLRTLYDGPLAPGMLLDVCREPADLIGATAFPLLHMQFAVAAARARRLPVVLFGALHPDDRWGFDRGVIKVAIKLASAYCAYTEYEREFVRSIGMPESRIHLIPPGIDSAAFDTIDRRSVRVALGIDSSDPVVGFFGQLASQKGVLDLLGAFEILARGTSSAHLVLAGARTVDTATIETAVSRLPGDIGSRVHLLVDVSDVDRPAVYGALDIFASPSGYESFGITTIEAWAARLPVVGCNVGATNSVIDNERDGLLVPHRDPAALATAITRLIASRDLRRQFGEVGNEKMQARYTWDRSAAAVDELYRSLVKS